MKVAWMDTETTGLDPAQNSIVQIALLVQIDGRIVDRWESRVSPFRIHTVNREALKVHGFSLGDIVGFPPARDVHASLINVLGKYIDKYDSSDKFHMAGFQTKFDHDFLSQWFKDCGDNCFGSWFNHRVIDVLGVYRWMEMTGTVPVLSDNKLVTTCNHFGIEIRAHDALADIVATAQVSKALENAYEIGVRERMKGRV